MRILILLAALSPCAALPAQITVPSSSSPTIQAGIDNATTGMTVRVVPGTYQENIDFKGKDITVMGLGPARVVIIDGTNTGPTVSFIGGETRKAKLANFTIRNGLSTGGTLQPGGGIQIRGSSPTIEDCIVEGCRSPAYGGGIGVTTYNATSGKAEPLIQRCVIRNNTAGGASAVAFASGAGIAFANFQSNANPGSPIVRECHFEGNTALTRGAGLYSSYGFAGTVDNCTFTRNTVSSASQHNGGSAMHLGLNSAFVVTNCRLWGNTGPTGAGTIKYFNTAGIYIVNTTIAANSGGGISGYANSGAFGSGTTGNVINTICWQNGSTNEITLGGAGNTPTIAVTYSCVTGGYAGTGNIGTDPLLANAATGNHRLYAASPCVNAGTGTPSQVPAVDFEGDTRPFPPSVDIGADERLPAAQLLGADSGELSSASPKVVTFQFECPGQGGALYLLLASLSGTEPGTPIGSLLLPLNIDAVTLTLLPVVPGMIGTLDSSGQAKAPITLAGIPKEFVGVDFNFAGLLIQGAQFSNVTNADTLRIAP